VDITASTAARTAVHESQIIFLQPFPAATEPKRVNLGLTN
jgi:hypothetical protein